MKLIAVLVLLAVITFFILIAYNLTKIGTEIQNKATQPQQTIQQKP